MKASEFEKTQGTYVGIKLDEASIQEIVNLQKVLHLKNPLDPSKFHVTVLYSRKRVNVPVVERTFLAQLQYVDCWKTQDGNFAVVAKMSCPELVERHEDLISIGGTHDYPDYTPHITLSYDDKITPIEVSGDVRLVNEYVESLKLDWISDNE